MDGLSQNVILQYYQINMTFNYVLQTKRTDVLTHGPSDKKSLTDFLTNGSSD